MTRDVALNVIPQRFKIAKLYCLGELVGIKNILGEYP